MKVIEIFGNIFEGAVGAAPTYKDLTVEAAIKFLNAHCKDAIWMLEKNRPLWRGISDIKEPGISSIKDFALVDTSLTTRKSNNTTNYYTVILDNNPLNKDFPKRSKSFVGTTSLEHAEGYSARGTDSTFAMIPTGRAKIGIVNHADMWHTKIHLFGLSKSIEQFNSDFHFLFDYPEEVTIDMFKDFDKKLENGDVEAIDRFYRTFGSDIRKWDYHLNFLKQIFGAYSSKGTGHEWCYASNFPKRALHEMTEVWVSGKIVLIRYDMWNSLIRA